MSQHKASPSMILISAWNESGGGFTHRLFDGHPECFVYPFEIQMGTKERFDHLDSWFSSKYRWPYWSKPLQDLTPEDIFDSIQDSELKGYLLDPASSKFKDFDLQLSFDSWKACFVQSVTQIRHVNRRSVLESYFTSFFESWSNYNFSGNEKYILGHCPGLVVDFDQIYHESPNMKMIHIFRSPYSGFIDFKNRVPSALPESYCHKWSMINGSAFLYGKKYPFNCHLVKYENLLVNRVETLQGLCRWLEIQYDPVLEMPTWNSQPLNTIYPFGGVQTTSASYEQECMQRLSKVERAVVDRHTHAVYSLLEDTQI